MKPEGPSAWDRLKELGPEIFGKVIKDLENGESPMKLAQWVQNDLGKLTDIKLETLKKAIGRYREKKVVPEVMARIAGASHGMTTRIVLDRLNSMDELEEMVRIQKGRVEKLLMREQSLAPGLLLKDASAEIKLLKDLLSDLSHIHMETGVMRRAPRHITGSLTDALGQVTKFDWNEERETLYRELTKTLAEANVIEH